MESSNFVMALVSTFIGVAILLSIGIQVLGNVQTSVNCTTLPGGFHVDSNFGSHTNNGTTSYPNSSTNATGWGLSCFNSNTNIQNGYALLLVIVVVIAAVAILSVVRLL